ncbi:hypothetical protein GCM10011428_30430 [Streptomyces violaceus]
MEIVHVLPAVAVAVGRHSARFAQRNGMQPTDVRALIVMVRPPRDLPRPWSSGSAWLPPGGSFWACPSRRAPTAC